MKVKRTIISDVMNDGEILKTYDLHSVEAYYDMIIDSFINGQKKQCFEQYMSMEDWNREAFLTYLCHTSSCDIVIRESILQTLLYQQIQHESN